MASYQARHRDPLLDSNMQAMLERRSKELLGFGLLVAAVLVAIVLGSYSPDDPSWMSATDTPANNLLGRFGAALARVRILDSGPHPAPSAALPRSDAAPLLAAARR